MKIRGSNNDNVLIYLTREELIKILDAIELADVTQRWYALLSEASTCTYDGRLPDYIGIESIRRLTRDHLAIDYYEKRKDSFVIRGNDILSEIDKMIRNKCREFEKKWFEGERYQHYDFIKKEFLKEPSINPVKIVSFILAILITSKCLYPLINKYFPVRTEW